MTHIITKSIYTPSNIYNFYTQLSVGELGEQHAAHDLRPQYKIRRNPYHINSFDWYVWVNDVRRTIEQKTDTYDMEKTRYMFIERYSDFDRRTNGGIWQASDYGADYFLYYFIKNKVYLVFNTQTLLERINSICSEDQLVPVRNGGYTSMGYKVERIKVLDICQIWKFSEKKQCMVHTQHIPYKEQNIIAV